MSGWGAIICAAPGFTARAIAERSAADRIKLPVTLADFGGNTENFQRFLLTQPPQIPCGWDERDALV